MSRLKHEKSPYLRHAAETQKIDWHPWSDEAFEAARAADKPIFLSAGAVWCHWCHVMAKESFEDDETAALLNERFINIKLDRDERPDIDRRYQQTVAAMGERGGWPLSVFLTADREAFFGGTYFPPRDMQGMPGFKSVLRVVSEFYKTNRSDVLSFSARVMQTLKQEPGLPRALSPSMLAEAEQSMLAFFDTEHGGFGQAPKFPMPGTIEFLIRRIAQTENPLISQAVQKTLISMAQGGFYDHLGGGFHRYSTDRTWSIPHFEKMTDDNAGLLRNYLDGYAQFGGDLFREISQGIIAYTREILSDPDGGFFASQDADVTPDDEGGYFTWTEEDFRTVLTDEEYPVLIEHLFGLRAAMHHNPAKQVLCFSKSPNEIADRLGKPIDEIRRIILQGKAKLLAARGKRQTPFVDKTLYTSLNGMMIAAYFHAFNVLGDKDVLAFAAKSLDRMLRDRFVLGSLLHTDEIPGVLEDYVHLVDALIQGYEATAQPGYLGQADQLMTICMEKFFDKVNGGFFDTEQEVLGTRLKRIEDAPHPSTNGVAIALLLKLSLLTGKEAYEQAAEQTLRFFADPAQSMSLHAGAYFSALHAWFNTIKLTIEVSPGSKLARKARAITAIIPVALLYAEDRGRVLPCKGKRCFEPIIDPENLKDTCLRLA